MAGNQLELGEGTSDLVEAVSGEEKTEAERTALLRAVSAGSLDTVQQRVAWILNHDPKSRDSDITLQLRYWELFHPDAAGDDYILKQHLYALPRLTSLSRARAKIQNTYKLFVASPEIRRYRGQLSEEERQKAAEQRPSFPLFSVYADESGKQGKYLIVGSIWFLHPPDIISFRNELMRWKRDRKFDEELHFRTITSANLHTYLEFADWLEVQTAVVSFKAISVERAGVKNVEKALESLFYHLLVRGVEHEDATGRASLPRGIELWKDQVETGRDNLFLAELGERLQQASAARFDGRLSVGELAAIDSVGQPLVQVADLYTGSLNRVLNATGNRTGPKDTFADRLLHVLGLPHGPSQAETLEDMTIHISL